MNPEKLSWDMSKTDSMVIVISYEGKKVMSLSLHEAIESAGRKAIMKHVRECDRTPWLKKWHDDKMEQEIEILKGNEVSK